MVVLDFLIPALDDAVDHSEPKASPLLTLEFPALAALLVLLKELAEEIDGREVAAADVDEACCVCGAGTEVK